MLLNIKILVFGIKATNIIQLQLTEKLGMLMEILV